MGDKVRRFKPFVFFVLFCLPVTVFSQSLRGVVTDDATHEPIPGASVLIKNTSFGTITTAAGYYQFDNLPPGKYVVNARFVGYSTIEEAVEVKSDGSERENFKLKIATTTLGTVVVRGTATQGTDVGARRKEKKSSAVVNVVSAQTIEHSPDLNVADISQRVSGITLDRSADSKSEFVIIRGMEQRYNNTLINGIKIPSTDPTSRSVPLEVIPSELIGNLVVSKTLTPDMEGDAIGGTVDIQMKDAPADDLLNVNVAGGYNQTLINSQFKGFDRKYFLLNSPSALHGAGYTAKPSDFNYTNTLNVSRKNFTPTTIEGVTFGKRFLNNKLGFILSGSDQTFFTGSHSTYTTYVTSKYNESQPQDFSIRNYSTRTNHIGVNTKLDYIFNSSNKMSLIGVYLKSTDQQVRITIDTSLRGNGRGRPGTGRTDSVTRSRYNIQTLSSLSLQGSNSLLKNVGVSWNLNYAKAVAQTPDLSAFGVYGTIQPNGRYQDGGQFFDTGGLLQYWQKNNDRDISVKIDFLYTPKIYHTAVEFKLGGLYRKKNRDNFNNSYTFNNADIPATPFRNLGASNVILQSVFGLGKYNPANYTADEKITAFYVQSQFHVGKFEALVGVRDEITNSSNQYFLKPYGEPISVNHYYNYNDPLPSVNIKYSFTAQQALRLSFYKSISRPNYFELVPYSIPTATYQLEGNPNLDRVRAFNYDLRYEIFPNPDDALMVGVFYKRLNSPIEQALAGVGTGGIPTLINVNTAAATNYGAELNVIKYFGDFGISANYTYTHSNIPVQKRIYLNTGADSTQVKFSTENRPLQGQSANVANASLLYRNIRSKINLNISLLFQGKRVDQISPDYGKDIYQLNFYSLSFSGDKTFGKRFTVFAKADNLTNSPFELRTKTGLFVQKDLFGQDYLLGLKIKFF